MYKSAQTTTAVKAWCDVRESAKFDSLVPSLRYQCWPGVAQFSKGRTQSFAGFICFLFFLHMFQMERLLEPAHGHISFIDGPLFCRFSFSINKKHSVFCAFALRHSWLFELRKAPKPCKQGLYRHGKKKCILKQLSKTL